MQRRKIPEIGRPDGSESPNNMIFFIFIAAPEGHIVVQLAKNNLN